MNEVPIMMEESDHQSQQQNGVPEMRLDQLVAMLEQAFPSQSVQSLREINSSPAQSFVALISAAHKHNSDRNNLFKVMLSSDQFLKDIRIDYQ